MEEGLLLRDPVLAARLGGATHERSLQSFLGDRQLESYVELVTSLTRASGPGESVRALVVHESLFGDTPVTGMDWSGDRRTRSP